MRGRKQNRRYGTKHSWVGNETNETTLGVSEKFRIEARSIGAQGRRGSHSRHVSGVRSLAVLHFAAARVSSEWRLQLYEHLLTFKLPPKISAFLGVFLTSRVRVPEGSSSFMSCRLRHTLQKLESVPPPATQTTIWEIANAHRDKVRAVQGSSSITRSPTVLIDTLSGHCVSSRCRTRRPLPLGPCAR